MGPLIELVQVPLDGILSLRCVDCTTQLGVICTLAEGALDPAMSLMKYWSQYGPLRDRSLVPGSASDQEHGRPELANRGGAAAEEQRSSLRGNSRRQGEQGRRQAGCSRPSWHLK